MSKRLLGLLLLGIWIGGVGVAHAAVTADPNPLDLGSVVVGQSKSGTTTLSSNTPGGDTVTLVPSGTACPQFSISPTSTTVGPRQPQDDQPITVTFTPASIGDKTCSVAVMEGSSTLKTLTLKGKGIPQVALVAPTNATLQFNQDINTTSATQPVTIRNDGDTPLTITSSFTGAGSPYTASPDPAGPLAKGDTATWNIACTPTTFGPHGDTFHIASDSATANTVDIALACMGNEGILALDAQTIAFGAVPRDTPQTKTFTLTNVGNVDVTVTAIPISPSDVGYTLDPTTVLPLTVPAASPPNNTKTVGVIFKPENKTDGSATASFTATWGASATAIMPITLDLTGTEASYGLTPAQPTIDFGKFRYDTHPRQMFQVQNDGNAPFTLRTPFAPDPITGMEEVKAELNNGTVNVMQSTQLDPPDHLTVIVSPQVMHRIGLVSGHVEVTPSIGPPLLVPVTGIATAAEVEAPAMVSFGVVSLDAPPATQTIAIKNTGEGTLDITSITVSTPGSTGAPNPAFEITLPPALPHVAPGATLEIPVVYHPAAVTTAGSDTVNLTAQLAGSLNAQLGIQITGDAAYFQAHGSGGCDAGGAGRGGGLAIGLAALLVLRRRRRLTALAIAALAGTAALAPAARADGIGIAVFAPTPATTGEGFALQAPDVGASGSWVANAVVSYASNPLVIDSLAGAGPVSSALVKRSTLMQVGLAYALLGRLELGAHLPLYQQSGEPGPSDGSGAGKAVKGTATGNLALHVKARLVRAGGDAGAFVLGASAMGTIPTATRDQFTGADQPEGRLLVLGSFTPAALDARLTISVNAGPVIRAESRYLNIVQKSAVAWGGGASVRILDELWATAELFGEATPSGERQQPMAGATPPPTTLSAIEGLAGITLKPDHRVSIGLAVGRGLTAAIGTPDLRGVLSVSIVPGAATLAPIHPVLPDGDADGDGIPDSVDRCPHEPEDKDGFEDQDGCPDPDNDHDGIPDGQDKCPLDPEDKDGVPGRSTAAPTRTTTATASPTPWTSARTSPRTRTGSRTSTAAPTPTTITTASPTRRTSAPTSPRRSTGSRTTTAVPTRATRRSSCRPTRSRRSTRSCSPGSSWRAGPRR